MFDVKTTLSGGGFVPQTVPRTYSAFISYRHTPDDMRIAREVHRKLERFHIDRQTRAASGYKTLAPIFRDEDELPISSALDDDLIMALQNASALIVICSPRTNESTWVAREVDEFLKTHEQSRVFVALVEGEPRDVVPPRLLYKIGPDGTHIPVEPLAANLRSDVKGSARQAEITRLAAGILAVPYDSLVRRAQRRRQRIGAALAGAAVAASTAFGLYNAYMTAQIKANYQQALQRRSEYLATEANLLLEQGNTIGATELALASLPDASSPDTLDRPVVPDAVYALQQATNAGVTGTILDYSFTTTEVYTAESDLKQLSLSPSSRYLALVDETEMITTWDTLENRRLFQGRSTMGYNEEMLGAFVLDSGDTIVAYSRGAVCRSAQDGSVAWRYETGNGENDLQRVCIDEATGGRLLLAGPREAHILDAETGSVLFSTSLIDVLGKAKEDIVWTSLIGGVVSKGGLFAFTMSVGDDTGFTGCFVFVLDAQTKEVRAFEAPGLFAFDIGLINDGSVLVTLGDDPDALMSDRDVARTTEYTSTTDYDLTLACLDGETGKTRWSRTLTVWQVGFDMGFAQLTDISEGDPSDIVACWLCDLVLFVDARSGEVINQLECASSIVGGGLLSDGQTFMGVQADGSLFSVTMESPKVVSYRVIGGEVFFAKVLPSSELYLIRKDVAYAYRGIAQDAAVRLAQVDLYDMSWEFASGGGFVVATMPSAEDALSVKAFDAKTLNVMWEQEFGADGMVWAPLEYDAAADKLMIIGYDYNEGAYVTSAIVRIDAETGAVERWDVTPCAESGLVVTQDGEARESVQALVVGYSACYHDGAIYSQVEDANGFVGVASASLDTGESTCYAVAEGFGKVADRGTRRLYLSIDPTGRRMFYQDVDSTLDEESGLELHPSAVLDLQTGQSTPLDESVATIWEGYVSSRTLQGHAIWSADGSALACVTGDGVWVHRFDGRPATLIELDGHRVSGALLVNDRLIVALAMGYSVQLEGYSITSGERFASCLISDGSEWVNAWEVVPEALAADGSGGLFVRSEACGYLIDMETLSPCQRFLGGRCYNRRLDTLLSSLGDGSTYYACERYTLQRLVDRGKETIGSQTMGEDWLRDHGA